jgi:hypothetical protein
MICISTLHFDRQALYRTVTITHLASLLSFARWANNCLLEAANCKYTALLVLLAISSMAHKHQGGKFR